MEKAIFFDIDDTLYNQMEPFKKSFEKNFNFFNSSNVEEIFKTSRKLSDEVFEMSENGLLSMDDMQVYRIQRALEIHGYKISTTDALLFQQDYSDFQKQISLSRNMSKLFDFLIQQKVSLGIITNGPSEHQKAKIDSLGLSKWIPAKRILISSEVHSAKPDKKIFDLAKMTLDNNVDRYYFVGDSFLNDVQGAKNAGWSPIWYNHRKRVPDGNVSEFDFEVTTEEELVHLIDNIACDKVS